MARHQCGTARGAAAVILIASFAAAAMTLSCDRSGAASGGSSTAVSPSEQPPDGSEAPTAATATPPSATHCAPSSAPQFVIDDTTGFDTIAGGETVVLTTLESSLQIEATNEDPTLLLPVLPQAGPQGLSIQLELVAPAETVLQLFYLTALDQVYAEDRQVSQPLREGSNSVTLVVPASKLYGRVRLDPGAVGGVYQLYSVRAAPVQ